MYYCIADSAETKAYLDTAQTWFKNKSRDELKNLLGLYFKHKGYISDIATFINEIEDTEENQRLSSAITTSLPNKGQLLRFMRDVQKMSRKQNLLSYDATKMNADKRKLSLSLTPREIHEATQQIAFDFSFFIDAKLKEYDSRQEVLDAYGGVGAILSLLKTRYSEHYADAQRYLADEERDYKRKRGVDSIPEEAHARMKKAISQRAPKYKLVVENFDRLAMLAMPDIEAREYIITDYYGNTMSYKHDSAQEEKLDDDDGNIPKGDVYNRDYRTLDVDSTITKTATRVLNNVMLTNEKGMPARNFLGKPKFVEPLLVRNFLLEIVENANNSEEMMELLQDRANETPWIKNLIDYIDKNEGTKTAIYDSFKKDTLQFETAYYDSHNEPSVGSQNTKEKRAANIRVLRSTIMSGLPIQKETSVYDESGFVTDEESLEKIDELFNTVFGYIKHPKFSMRMNSVEGSQEKRKEFLAENPDAVHNITKALRSLGFEVSENVIMRLFTDSNKYSKYDTEIYGRNGKAYSTLKTLKEIYDKYKAKRSSNPGEILEFINLNEKQLLSLSRKIGQVSYDSFESKTLINGKTYSAKAAPNLIHHISRMLKGQLSETDAAGDAYDSHQNYIYQQIGKYEGFNLSGEMIGWLKEAEPNLYFDIIDVMFLQDRKFKKEYKDWDFVDNFKVRFAYFRRANASNRKAAFEFPPLADYDVCNMITAPLYDTDITKKDAMDSTVDNLDCEIVERFTEELKAEIERIRRLNDIKNNDDKEQFKDETDDERRSRRIVLNVYENSGAQFTIFPSMNEDGFLDRYNEKVKDGYGIELDNFLKHEVIKHLQDTFKSELDFYIEQGVFESEEFRQYKNKNFAKDSKIAYSELRDNPNAKVVQPQYLSDKGMSLMQGFILNDLYAQLQISKIFFGGIQYYNSVDEYHKRAMFEHAPGTPIDTKATYKGEKAFESDEYNVAVVEDVFQDSAYLDELERLFDQANKAGLITKEQAKQFIDAYKNINPSDGQALRSLPTFRAVMIARDADNWTDRHEAVYNALMSGNVTPDVMDDFITLFVFQPIKSVITGFEEINHEGTLVRHPLLYKHAEVAMIAPYIAESLRKSHPQFSSPIIMGIGNFMKNNGVDVVEFHSSAKLTEHGIIRSDSMNDLSGTPEEIMQKVENELTAQYNSIQGSKHTVNYSTQFRIAASNPTAEAGRISLSSQPVKQVWGNIEKGDSLTTLDNKTMRSSDAKQEFYDLGCQLIERDWKELLKLFKDKRKLSEILQKELATKSYNSSELSDALALIEKSDGKLNFAINPMSPTVSTAIQQLFSSLIRTRIGKTYTKGALLINQTSLGYNVKFNNTVNDYQGEWEPLGIAERRHNADGSEGLVFGTYVTLTDDDALDGLARFTDETGAITPKRLKELVANGTIDERILYCFAYRTPSDGVHSVIPFKIMGFLPKSMGHTALMSSMVQSMTGNDNDNDSMHFHFMEYRADTPDVPKSLRADQEFPIKLVEYDPNGNNSRAAINNRRNELIFSMLTSKKGSMQLMFPGGFEPISRKAYAHKILHSQDPVIVKGLKKWRDEGKSTYDIYNRLMKESSGTLRKKANSEDEKKSVLTQSSRDIAHQNILGGRQLIGRYALPNSGSALLQNSGLKSIGMAVKVKDKDGNYVKDENDNFVYERSAINICGYTIDALDGLFVKDTAGQKLKSIAIAYLISAGVDNRNKPILGYLNQNDTTVDITTLLTMAEVPDDLIFTFINQPVVVELAKRAKSNPTANINSLIQSIRDSIIHRLENSPIAENREKASFFPRSYKTANKIMGEMSIEQLFENEVKSLQSNDIDFLKEQVAQLIVLQELYKLTDQLHTLIMSLRPENAKSGTGPLVVGTISNIKRIEDFQDMAPSEKMLTSDKPLLTLFRPDLDSNSSVMERAKAENEIFPMETLMNSLELYGAQELMSEMFKQASENWQKVYTHIINMYDAEYLKDSLKNQIFNEMITYKISGFPEIVDEPFDNFYDFRNYMVMQFPVEFKSLLGHLQDVRKKLDDPKTASEVSPVERRLAENKLLQSLYVSKFSSKAQIQRIAMRARNTFTSDFEKLLRAAWTDLLYIDDSITIKGDNNQEYVITPSDLALKLQKYNLFSDGFGFGQFTFNQLATVDVQMRVKGWQDGLDKLLTPEYGDFTEDEKNIFGDLYVMNHWYDNKLVKRVNDDTWKKVLVNATDDNRKVVLKDYINHDEQEVIEVKNLFGNSNFITHFDEKNDPHLYKLIAISEGENHDDLSYVFEEYPALGSMGMYSKVNVQYDPHTRDPKSVTPIENPYYELTTPDSSSNIEDAPDNDFSGKNLTKEQIQELQRQRILRKLSGESEDMRMASRLKEIQKRQPDTQENTDAQLEAAVTHNDEQGERDRILASLGADFSEDESGEGTYYMLVRHSVDEKGKPIVQTEVYSDSPEVVDEARDQKVNYELNKYLRDMFQRMGVSIGVLNDYERSLGVAGVTDFKQAIVTAETIKELIRLSDGEEGELALPEEAAHLSIAMLGYQNPFVDRLMNAMTDDVIRDVLGDYYDEYFKLYKGNKNRMAFEAAGKLVAKHMLDNEPIPNKPYKNILQKVIDAIKNFFRKLTVKDVDYAIARANDAAEHIASGILSGELADLMNLNNITETEQYFDLTDKIDKNTDLLKNILQKDVKRLDLITRKARNMKNKEHRSLIINQTDELVKKIERSILATKKDIAINDYMKASLKYIERWNNSLTTILKNSNENAVCGRLRICRDIIYSFDSTLEDLRQYARENPNELSDATISLLAKCQDELTKFRDNYHNLALTFFHKFIVDTMGTDEMIVPIGKNRGSKITAREMMLSADKDISILNRFLDSMADQPDMLNKLFDKRVKEQKRVIYELSTKAKHRINAAFQKYLKSTGSRDQSFMFEYKDGKKTGRYVSKEYAEANFNAAQKEYYNEMMSIYDECMKLLPDKICKKNSTIKIRKDLVERMRSSESVNDSVKSIWKALQDKLLVRADDDEYHKSEAIVDFEGNKYDTVPIYYLHLAKGETEDDMSDDVASTMLAFAHMAYNYDEMNKIVNIIENARSMALERDVTVRRGKRVEQQTVESGGHIFAYKHTKKERESWMGQMLNDFMSMQFYGHMRKDQGTIPGTQISWQKAADVLNEATSISQLGLNIPQRLSNVNTGIVQLVEEVMARDFFKGKNMAKAQTYYFSHIGEYYAKYNLDENDSMISLLDEMFDIRQENMNRFKGQKYRKTRLGKTANLHLLTAGLSIGERYLNFMTALSVLDDYRMKKEGDTSGETVSILEVLEREYVDPKNKLGASLKIKDGYVKENGEKFTSKDIVKLTNRIAGINFRLNGIYNTMDKSMILQYSAGTIIMMFRKWMVPSLRRRYGGTSYDFMTEEWTEGFYTTVLNFLRDVSKDFKHLSTSIKVNWEKMTDYEKANITRAITEIGQLIGLSLSIMSLGRIHLDDDQDGLSEWGYNMVLYQLYRLRAELGSMAPTHLIIKEGQRILEEPFAGMRTIENTFALLDLFDTQRMNKVITRGRYKGKTYRYKTLTNLPYISIFNTAQRVLDVSDLLDYYKSASVRQYYKGR